MAKKFTIVTIGEEEEVFLTGYREIEKLHEVERIVEILSEIPDYEPVHLVIQHCQFLDFPEPIEDITLEELEILLENYDEYIENDNIFLDEEAEIDITGLKEEEFVE